eukprot:gene27468-34188_t
MAVVNADITNTLKKLLLYPIILIVCWVGATTFDMYELFRDMPNRANDSVTVICILQGSLLAVAFFAMNGNVRQLWYYLLTCNKKTVGTNRRDRNRTQSNFTSRTISRSTAAPSVRLSQMSCTFDVDEIEDSDTNNNQANNTRNTNGGGDGIDINEMNKSSMFEFADRAYSSAEFEMTEFQQSNGENTSGGEDSEVVDNPLVSNGHVNNV